MKLCSECKHYAGGSTCWRNVYRYGIDPINGSFLSKGHLDCYSERKRRFIFKTNCGPEGKFWEPKNDYEHLNKYWVKGEKGEK
jgi:hypothetical protein